MRIGGYRLRDHIRLLAPLFGFIAAVWALRLVLQAAGAPSYLVHACSVTVAGSVSVLFAALLIYSRRFGSYPNVVAAAFLLSCWQHFLIAAAIAFSAFTGVKNIYSTAEYARGTVSLAQHIAAHLILGVPFGTLFGAAMGSLVLWMLRRMVPTGSAK